MMDERQPELFPELAPQQRPACARPVTLYRRAKARRQLIEKMTRKGALVREIADAASCTITHVLRVRKELRDAGRLPDTPRTAAAKCHMKS